MSSTSSMEQRQMRYSILIFILAAACGDNLQPPASDATAIVDVASSTDAVIVADVPTIVDAASILPDAPMLDQCSTVCPDEEWFAWAPMGTYRWTFCLPSYRRCIDPSQLP